jgi:hypothetical protein
VARTHGAYFGTDLRDQRIGCAVQWSQPMGDR